MKSKTLYDTYIAARDALQDHASEEFKRLAEDLELVDALAWLHQSSREHILSALANPRRTHIERRYNGVGDVVGIDYVVRNDTRSRSQYRTRKTEIPLELLICETGAFQAWRDKTVLRFKEESEKATTYTVNQAKKAPQSYRRLPKEVREANPIPGVKR